ncbi:MAG: ADP-glyceromanno-heptose 6-epimerase [Terriglobales bacterium]
MPKMQTGRSAVVTGGAGFIGSQLCAHLARQGWAVTVVDAPGTDGRLFNLSGVSIADFWLPDDFLEALRAGHVHPQVIFHLGACTSTTERDADYLMRNNFSYTRTLALWCLEHGVRFIYASSAATYGDGSQGFSDSLDTTPRLRPLNKYAFSKHAFDLWALHHGAFSGPNAITGVKYFNVYGPNEYHKGTMHSMVLETWEQIQATGKIKLFRSHRPEFRDGEQRRDFIYVADAVALTAWFYDHPQASGLYNLGSGRARTWNDLVALVFAAIDRPPQVEYIPMPENVRAAYQYDTCADLSRLRAAGCTLAPRSLEDGVREYMQVLMARSSTASNGR